MGYRRKILEAKKVSRHRKSLVKDEDYSAVNRQCLKKAVYHSEKKVMAKINQIAEEGRRSLRYYLCPFCEFWHISHKALGDQKFVS